MRTRWVATCRDCAYHETAPNAATAMTWASSHESNRVHIVDVNEVAR